MNIQQSVRLIIFIYQQESLRCCSMSVGYGCNKVSFVFIHGWWHLLCSSKEAAKQKTGGGWSEHWDCKWQEGLSSSLHHGARFCSADRWGDTCSGRQVVGDSCHAGPPPGTALFSPIQGPPQYRRILSQFWGLVAESCKHARNCPCGVGHWVSVPGKVPCYIGATCTSPLAGFWKPSRQRKLSEHLSLLWNFCMSQT